MTDATIGGIDEARLMAAVEESMFGMSDTGFCLSCQEEVMGVEPDASGRHCDACGENNVMGAENILLNFVS